MRNLLFLFTFFLFSQITTAQLGQWFIDKVIIEGIEYQAPINSESEQFRLNIYWDWDIYVFDNNHCGGLINGAGIWFDNETLYLGYLFHFTSDCVNSENNIFRDQHFGIYLKDTDQNFDYEVSSTSNGDSQLVITNEFGNKVIYLSSMLGIQDENLFSFKIYPNPVSEQLFIASEHYEIESVIIYSVSGKKIMEIDSIEDAIDVSSLSEDMYFVVVSTSEGKSVQKFIKH